jgi:hypothetical protein
MEDEPMNRTFAYTIAAAGLLSAGAVWADDTAEPTLEERIAALEERNAQSSWTEKIQLKGDLRYRYELQTKDDETSKNRQRIRARIGAYAEVNEITSVGIRLRTGQDANSGNETIGSEFDSKDIYLDLAYIELAPAGAQYGTLTLGKMKYPWKVTTDLIWDGDVNPEGIAYTYAGKLDKTGIFGSAGYFKVNDSGSAHDLNLATVQAGLSQPLGEKTKFTLGGSLYVYDNAQDFNDPGETNNTTLVDYTIGELFAEMAFKDVLPTPFKLYGNYVNNTEENTDSEGFCVGVKFNDAKKGKWEAKLGYRDLDSNAAPSYYADSDFAGGGTNIKGIRLKGSYNLFKNLQVAATYIAGEQKDSNTDVNTLHLDLIAKF